MMREGSFSRPEEVRAWKTRFRVLRTSSFV